MITITQYFMGRDEAYAAECTLQIRRNAASLLLPVNALLSLAAAEGVTPWRGDHDGFPSDVVSGWRPHSVNDATSHAGKFSAHLDALALDMRDAPDRRLARWSLRNAHPGGLLEQHGIYMEDPRWTPSWVHWSTRVPGSGHRVFIPSAAPPLALALPEQAVA